MIKLSGLNVLQIVLRQPCDVPDVDDQPEVEVPEMPKTSTHRKPNEFSDFILMNWTRLFDNPDLKQKLFTKNLLSFVRSQKENLPR